MNRTAESSTKSAVRVTVATSRCIVRRNQLQGQDSDKVSSFVMLSNGEDTVVSGYGYLIDTFIRTKQLSGYPGQNENVSVLSDVDYKESKLKLMRFDQTFDKMPYDASKRKICWFLIVKCECLNVGFF